MTEGAEPSTSALQAISNAMVRLAFQAATE
jgi:hypothetical protein